MASRRDQLQSYQFLNQRVISAFVMRETDPAQSPLRRGVGALFAGLMLAVLIAAGYGIYGVLTKTGADEWKSEGSVVVERESGASFVYRGGRLTPALNFASAKLAAGRADPAVFRVAAKALAGEPRGATIGIPNAPASLPAADRRSGLPWAMCVLPGGDPVATLVVGAAGPGGAPLGEQGLLVTDGDADDAQLIWGGAKYRIANAQIRQALFGAERPREVGTAWLNTVPAGADIEPIAVPDAGQPSAEVDGFDNGDVLQVGVGAGKRQFYLVLRNGRLPITELQQTVQGADPREVRNAEISGTRELQPDTGKAAAPPPSPPEIHQLPEKTTVCAVTRAADRPPEFIVDGAAAGLAAAVPTTGAAGGRALADTVLVKGGTFALVRVPGSGGFQYVTDLGVRHPVPGDDALGRLGYAPSSAIEVPTALVSALPEGVTLDPAAATRPAGD